VRADPPALRADELLLESLEAENGRLKQQLERLIDEIDAVEYRDGVYLVGKGAEAFAACVDRVEARLGRAAPPRRADSPEPRD